MTEGEKAADAAGTLGLLATTSPHGASSAAKADWRALAGRDVAILPDNDDAGRRYAEDVAAILLGLEPPATVRIVPLPELGPAGTSTTGWRTATRWSRRPCEPAGEPGRSRLAAASGRPGGGRRQAGGLSLRPPACGLRPRLPRPS